MKKNLWMIALLVAACESERSVGSTCVDGRCAQTQAEQEDPHVECSVYATEYEVAVDGDRLYEGCLPNAFVRDGDGKIACEMRWDLSATPTECETLGFTYEDEEGRCIVDQVPAPNGQIAQDAQGWFYEDGLELAECSISPAQRIALTAHVSVPEGTLVRMSCAQAWADPEEAAPALGPLEGPIVIDPAFCEPPADEEFANSAPADLGEGCVPLFLERALYDEHTAYVNLGSSQCETGACVVYHVDSQAHAQCIEETQMPCPGQTPPADGSPYMPSLAERAFCSCRCDGAPEGEPECDCAAGFDCVEVLTAEAPASIAGSYCLPAALNAMP